MVKNILMAEIMPIMEEFDEQTNYDTVYEFRLQAAANNFIEAASRLPRASGCFPPCGFQAQGAVYNCMTCQYDSCEFPLDCPVKEITIQENNRTQMWCKVPFLLPTDAEIVWRYAMESTMLMDRFDEVTVGVDPLYFIPSARPEHSGTYQCEIFSQEHSLVRIYYYLTVIPLAQLGHVELQDVFEQALLPGGQFPPLSRKDPFTLWVPSPALLTTCLTAMFLLVFLMLGFSAWSRETVRWRNFIHLARLPADGPKGDFAAFVEWVLVNNDSPFTIGLAEDDVVTSPTLTPPETSQPSPASHSTEMLHEPSSNRGDRPAAKDKPEPRKRLEGVISPEPASHHASDQVRKPATSQREYWWSLTVWRIAPPTFPPPVSASSLWAHRATAACRHIGCALAPPSLGSTRNHWPYGFALVSYRPACTFGEL